MTDNNDPERRHAGLSLNQTPSLVDHPGDVG